MFMRTIHQYLSQIHPNKKETSTVCNVTRMECTYSSCSECGCNKNTRSNNINLSEEVSWWEWVRVTEVMKKDNKTRKNAKIVKELQH